MGKIAMQMAAKRQTSIVLAVVFGFFCLPDGAGARQSQIEQGQSTFQTVCVACHTIGGGTLIGPDLEGVHERRSEEWIISFVQGSQALIAGGDSDAVALFQEFNQMMMPDFPLSDDDVRAVIQYVSGAEAAGMTPASQAPVGDATEAQIVLGQELFQGKAQLANGGPTCNSCHEVTNDAVIGGGVLARDLTAVFTRLGGPGVRAILGSPPFPVMQRAYSGKALTEEEVVALVGFLERADAEQGLHQPRDYGIKLFAAGVVGAAILLVLYSLAWGHRKKESVNQSIFDRQIAST